MFHSQPDLLVVGEAESATAALQVVQEVACDLVLADYSLPDHEGPWLIAQLKKLVPHLPVLMLSQNTELERVRQILSLGAQGYLVKTAQRQELLQAVQIVKSGGIYLHPMVAGALTATTSAPILSPRERQILSKLTQGKSNPAIASELHVSLGTIKADLQSLFQKLGARDRTQLAATALARGLIDYQ